MLVATVKDVKEAQPVISRGCAQKEGKGRVHPEARIPSDTLSPTDEVMEDSVFRVEEYECISDGCIHWEEEIIACSTVYSSF